MPKPYPSEFRDDVVRVAQNRELGVTIEQIRELRKRNRLLEHESEVLRRAAAYLSQANLPGKATQTLPASPGPATPRFTVCQAVAGGRLA